MRSKYQANKPARPHSPNAHGPARLRIGKTLGLAMVAVGALLLTLISGYYAYSASARSQLDELNFVVEQPSQPPQASLASPSPGVSSQPAPVTPSQNTPAPESAQSPAVKTVSLNPPSQPIRQSASLTKQTLPANPASPANQTEPAARPPASYSALYPATRIHPKFWAQPLWSGGEPYVYNPSIPDAGLPDGFRAASATDDALRRGNGALPTRISIPLIDVDSETKELAILNLGDSRAYETPKHLVGHIPKSPNPGEIGNAWYFGHLESPIKGEGSVFRRLPEIPDLLRDGDAVFVELESSDGAVFLYKTTRTEVIHQDELKLYGSDVAQITLVACVPRLVYDHRILITAELVGIKDAHATAH